jgi:hypothetical protein
MDGHAPAMVNIWWGSILSQAYEPWRCHGSLLRHPSFEFIIFNPIFRALTGAPNSETEHFSLALLVKSVRL